MLAYCKTLASTSGNNGPSRAPGSSSCAAAPYTSLQFSQATPATPFGAAEASTSNSAPTGQTPASKHAPLQAKRRQRRDPSINIRRAGLLRRPGGLVRRRVLHAQGGPPSHNTNMRDAGDDASRRDSPERSLITAEKPVVPRLNIPEAPPPPEANAFEAPAPPALETPRDAVYPQTAPKAPQAQWTCQTCTFINVEGCYESVGGTALCMSAGRLR